MFVTPEGKKIFVVDGHTHFWDGSPENQKNIHGKQFIDCFYAYHSGLSPKEQLWEKSKFEKYSAADLYNDLFINGPDDIAILNSTYLKDFYKAGFNDIERNASVAKRYPNRFIVNGAFDPRDGEKALEYIHYMKETHNIQGVKLYTAEWNGASKGWRLNDPDAYKCFELCEKLGIKNMHVHKGPTIIPLNKDAFDVHDVDYAATDFQGLNWIIEHCGLPRLDDFCWIATQETNVFGGLAVALPFIHSRPRYFGEVIAELLFWIGPEKILFGSDYAIWTPKWLVEKLWAYQIPEDIAKERGVQLTDEIKEKILGLNAARLYNIDIAARKAEFAAKPMSIAAEQPAMTSAILEQSRLAEVWDRLDLVMDPELDEPVTDMGFVETVALTGPGTVAVSFRLPTYWCSPNFAFLMAEGIKREVEALPWVDRAVITLEDHIAAAEMNAAINAGASFASVFAELQPDQDLAALKDKFDHKAFQRRQEVVIKALVNAGHSVEAIVAMPRAALVATSFDDPEVTRQQGRYLALQGSRGRSPRPTDPAFTDWHGVPLTVEGYSVYMGLLRSVRINMEFSGSLCRNLKTSRYKEADLSGSVPLLVDLAPSDPAYACR